MSLASRGCSICNLFFLAIRALFSPPICVLFALPIRALFSPCHILNDMCALLLSCAHTDTRTLTHTNTFSNLHTHAHSYALSISLSLSLSLTHIDTRAHTNTHNTHALFITHKHIQGGTPGLIFLMIVVRNLIFHSRFVLLGNSWIGYL